MESEFFRIDSAKNRVPDEVNGSRKKNEKLTTNFETVDDDFVTDKAFSDRIYPK